MKELSEITTDLELSKELKEAGYPQDSLFGYLVGRMGYGVYFTEETQLIYQPEKDKKGNFILTWKDQGQKYYSSPTAEELLKELKKCKSLLYRNYSERDIIDRAFKEFPKKKLKVALAKWWLYLKNGNLLEENNA